MSLQIDVRHRAVAVLGGSARSAARVAELLAEGARVTVVAQQLNATLEDLRARGLIRVQSSLEARHFDLVINTPQAVAVEPAVEGVRTPGQVTLVSAGPGDPELLTLAGRAAIEKADVIVADRLIPLPALSWAQDHAEIIDVGKIPYGRQTPQSMINDLLISHAKAGRTVVRLKGGDGFVFGRGAEEVRACASAGIPTQVVSGVSAAIAVPAAAGIPVTHRGLAQAFTVVSGHLPPEHPDSQVNWDALAHSGATLVILMGMRNLSKICQTLIAAGIDPSTPAAVIADGTLPSQSVVRGAVRAISEKAAAAHLGPPAVAVIGRVTALDSGA